MAEGLIEVVWEDVTEYVPAVVTALIMPFAFSIAEGIAIGFIVYATIQGSESSAGSSPPG